MKSSYCLEESLKDDLCFNIRKAARAVTRIYDKVLKPCGISSTQYSILVSLSKDKMLTAVAEEIGMERTTLTRNLAPLEKHGYICEIHGHLKCKYWILTEKGAEITNKAKLLWTKAQVKTKERLGKDAALKIRDIIGIGNIL